MSIQVDKAIETPALRRKIASVPSRILLAGWEMLVSERIPHRQCRARDHLDVCRAPLRAVFPSPSTVYIFSESSTHSHEHQYDKSWVQSMEHEFTAWRICKYVCNASVQEILVNLEHRCIICRAHKRTRLLPFVYLCQRLAYRRFIEEKLALL
jgi:hypothetical protein